MVVEHHQLLIYRSLYHKCFIKSKFDAMGSIDQFLISIDDTTIGV